MIDEAPDLVNTDLVYQHLELLITGHGAIHWIAPDGRQRIAIRRAIRPSGKPVYCTFSYRYDQLEWAGRPTESLRAAFCEMPSTPARIYTATHLALPGADRKRGTRHAA